MSEKNEIQVQLSIQTVDSTASQIPSLQYAENTQEPSEPLRRTKIILFLTSVQSKVIPFCSHPTESKPSLSPSLSKNAI